MAETLVDLFQRIDESSMTVDTQTFIKGVINAVVDGKSLAAIEVLVDEYIAEQAEGLSDEN